MNDDSASSPEAGLERIEFHGDDECPRWLLEMDRTDAARKQGFGLLRYGVLAKAVWIRETPQGCSLGFPDGPGWRKDLEKYAAHLHAQFPGISAWIEENGQELQLQMSAPPMFQRMIVEFVNHGKIPRSTKLIASLRRFKNKLYRLSSAPLRDLPDFLIIGAPRCGTTAMYTQLVKHPCVWSAANIENPGNRLEGKEIHYFDYFPHKGIPFYRAHFPLKRRRRRAQREGNPFLTGEATPTYLFEPGVARNVSEVLPAVKLIVMLRNPVDRAYSHYHMNRLSGLEPLSFEDATDDEKSRFSVISGRDSQTETCMRGYYSYLSGSLYADHLEQWFKFFPRNQFLIIRSEDYFQQPVQLCGRALDFLGLQNPARPAESGESTADNIKGVVKNQMTQDKLNPDTRKRLETFFEPHNERLRALLGPEFDWQ